MGKPASDTTGGSSTAGATSGLTVFSFKFANAQFDASKLLLTVAGQAVTLEPRPMQVLAELLHHANEVVTKEELFESVWDGRITVDNVLANAITKLRKALGEAAGACIVNVPRIGYRLVGPVERTAVGQPMNLPISLEPGAPVPGRGGFTLVRPLGGTGRGNVWLARKAKTGQERVFKFATAAQGLGSLKREYTLSRVLRAQLGGRPDLVAVHDANFSESPFSLEAEYVGPDLLAWDQATAALAQLTLPERLSLFLQIARTVAAAHALGILHKDIKPANVLVRGSERLPTLALADFGSGHLADAERIRQMGITAMGLTLSHVQAADVTGGTLMYLAPEVQAGQAGTVQSEVYALGVLLFQMLTAQLQRPLASGWAREIDDSLLVEDVAAATDFDPRLRLQSVASLIERIEHLALRRQASEQAATLAARNAELELDQRRKLQRRPWLVALVLSLASGFGISTWLWQQSAAATRAALEQSQRATAISKFAFQDVLESSDLLNAGAQAKPSTLLNILRHASAATAVRFAGQARVEAEAQMRLAQSFLKLAALQEAGTSIRKAQGLLKPVAAADDALVLKLRFMWAHWLVWTERREEGEAELLGTEGATPPELLAKDAELAIVAARARAFLLREKRELQGWREQQLKLMELTEKHTPPGSPERLDALQQYAESLIWLGQQAQAKQMLDGLAQPPFLVQGAYAEAMAKFHIFAGQRAKQLGDATLAAEQLTQALPWCLAGPPARRDWLEAWAQKELGEVLLSLGRVAAGAAASQRGHDLIVRVSGADHQYAHEFSLGVAENQLLQGHYAKALASLDEIEAFQQRAFGKRLWGVSVDFGRARAMVGLGRAAEATHLLSSIDRTELKRVTEQPDAAFQAAFWHGLALARSGHADAGVPMMRQALADIAPKPSYAWALPQWRQWMEQAATAR